MSIRRGESWGEHGPLPSDGVIARDDAAVRAVLERARRAAIEPPPIGLLGGDLCKTLGGRGDAARLADATAARLRIDAGRVTLDDGRTLWFVAHLLARRIAWRGSVTAIMNAAWRGSWNVAPRAHPGDGSLDIVTANLSPGDRWKARKRLPLGTHVPHPAITMRRASGEFELDLERAVPIWLDGERVGVSRRIRVVCEPEALAVVV